MLEKVVSGSGTNYWPLADHLGSVRDLLINDGTNLKHVKYDSFGNEKADSNPTLQTLYAFTGREYDVEAELQYNRARWYDPKTGRWLSLDPLGFDAGDSNLYRYVKNQAATSFDPLGKNAAAIGTAALPLFMLALYKPQDSPPGRFGMIRRGSPQGGGGDEINQALLMHGVTNLGGVNVRLFGNWTQSQKDDIGQALMKVQAAVLQAWRDVSKALDPGAPADHRAKDPQTTLKEIDRWFGGPLTKQNKQHIIDVFAKVSEILHARPFNIQNMDEQPEGRPGLLGQALKSSRTVRLFPMCWFLGKRSSNFPSETLFHELTHLAGTTHVATIVASAGPDRVKWRRDDRKDTPVEPSMLGPVAKPALGLG
jgi:RHS repeat-associated protein